MYKRKDTIRYNVMFPIWMLLYFPAVFLLTIPFNIVIDFFSGTYFF